MSQSQSEGESSHPQKSPYPPPIDSSVTAEPLPFEAVTPGIQPSTYLSHSSSGSDSPSYFSQSDHRLITAEPGTIAQSPSEAAAGATSVGEILRRMSLATMGRRESLTEIRATNPDLALSGNIISAAFNIPHSFKYRKGADWVSYDYVPVLKLHFPSRAHLLLAILSCFPQS
jgi:trehalose 6-phosphate synthase/phosphatase